jgi:hypothetical protein
MTSKADFTEEEWHQIATGPTGAGLMVATASRGGTFRESFSMAKAYAEARQQHGESQLLDELVGARPDTDRGGARTPDELTAFALDNIRGAVTAIEAKGTPEELEDYRRFVHGLAQRVAEAHSEGGEQVSQNERTAIESIDDALGAGASN